MKKFLLMAAMFTSLFVNAPAQDTNKTSATSTGHESASGPSTIYLAAEHVYKLRFVLKELDGGKAINSREYFMQVNTQGQSGNPNSLRVGNKIPLSTGCDKSGSCPITYVDVGVKIDANRLRTDGRRLFGMLTIETSSVVSESPAMQPVIRQNMWTANVALETGKPTVVASSDDVSSKRTLEVEVTATEVQ